MAARSFVGVAASLKNNITTRFVSRMGCAETATVAAATVEISGEKKAAVGQVVSNSTTAAAVAASYLSASSSSWMPDPVTGYYRPGNRRKEAEAAELQEPCLSHEQLN